MSSQIIVLDESTPEQTHNPATTAVEPQSELGRRLGTMGRVAGVCASRVLMFCVQIAYVRLYTRAVGTSELGYYYFIASAAAILYAALFIPFDEFQQAKCIALIDDGQGLRPLLRLNIRILAGCAGLTALAECVLRYTGFHPGAAALLVSLSVLTYASIALRRLLNNLRYWKTAQALSLLEPVLKCLAFALWIRGTHATGVDLAITTLAGGVGVVLLSAFAIVHYRLMSGSDGTSIDLKPLAAQIWPMSYGSIINLLQTYGYRLVLVPFGFSELVGVYGTVTQIGQAGMVSIANVFRQIYDPKLYETRGKYLGTYMKLAAFVSVICFLVALATSKLAIGLCTKPAFVPYALTIGYGVCAEAASLVLGGLFTYLTIVQKIASVRVASTCGLSLYVVTFAYLSWTRSLNPYTLGIPMVLSHLTAITFLMVQSLRADAERHAFC